jgi:hypothetical protein
MSGAERVGPLEVVHRRIREEDENVRRYLVALEVMTHAYHLW